MPTQSSETLKRPLKSAFFSVTNEANFSETRFDSFCDLFVFIVLLDWSLAQLFADADNH